jgi:hypothetical protein
MNVDTVIESAARNHKALLAVDVSDRAGQELAFTGFKESLEALMRDVAHKAFTGERSKRKQWAEVQKELGDLLNEARAAVDEGLPPEGNWEEKMDRRYQRMGSRIARLEG